MLLMNRDYPLSISLDQNTYRNAEEFAKAGFEAAECCLPTYYRDPVDLSIFEPFLNEEMCIRDRSSATAPCTA